jgi:hypothetical protein
MWMRNLTFFFHWYCLGVYRTKSFVGVVRRAKAFFLETRSAEDEVLCWGSGCPRKFLFILATAGGENKNLAIKMCHGEMVSKTLDIQLKFWHTIFQQNRHTNSNDREK